MIYFLFIAQSFKTIQECQHYDAANFSLDEVLSIQGHIRPLNAKIIQAHMFIDRFL